MKTGIAGRLNPTSWIKLFSILILLSGLTLIPENSLAKRIYCQKYAGKHKTWKIAVYFNKNGVMIVQVDRPGKGWTARLGQYRYKSKKLSAVIHSYRRNFTVKPGKYIKGTPYDFDIGKQYKTQIKIYRDNRYRCK